MKKILLLSVLATTVSMASESFGGFGGRVPGSHSLATASPANSSAPQTESTQPSVGDWSETFNTLVGPVEHNPSQVIFARMMYAKEINFSSKTFNGVPMKAPLVISVNMTREQFIQALVVSGIYK